MGVTASATKSTKSETVPLTFSIEDADRCLFKSMGFTNSDLNKFYKIFQGMDEDSDGSIVITEFISFFGLADSAFTYRAFALVDSKREGSFRFNDFLISVWQYCTLTQDSMIEYAFALYDADGSEEIDLEEAQMLVHEVWGEEWEKSSVAQTILEKLQSIMEKTAIVRLEEFKKLALQFPEILYPAYEMQKTLRERVLGTKICGRLEIHRKSITDPIWLAITSKMASMNDTTIQLFAFEGRIAKFADTAPKRRFIATSAAKKWLARTRNTITKKQGSEVVPAG